MFLLLYVIWLGCVISYFVISILLYTIIMSALADLLPRLGKRKLVFLLSITRSYGVSVWGIFQFLGVLWIGCVILLWHSLCLP